jgi:hypothetical protein
MSVTGAAAAGREEKLRQIDRLVHSSLLHGSESLCKLLRYLADYALEHPGESVKEYQIATEVFGRPATFDPRLDSTVRVQTGRLRTKLTEYYRGPGESDPLIVEIPRGTYQLTFVPRHADAPDAPALAPEPQLPAVAAPESRPDRKWLFAFCAMTLLAAALGAALLIRPASRPSTSARNDNSALRHFWSGFVDSPEPPWVIFSNAAFAGRPDLGMHYYDPVRDAALPVLDHYTGVGEVLAIHDLDEVFGALNHSLRIKRGRLLSLDDVKNNDLIFVGSPKENLTLREVPSTSEFEFRTVTEGARKGDVSIANIHPQSGEPAFWIASELPMNEDYAVVALVAGLNPAYRALILAGTTTLGTQAAVEYVCRESTVRGLLQRAGSTAAGVRPFEAVLHVDVKEGVPVQSRIVALRIARP